MFTGLVRAVGTVREMRRAHDAARLSIDSGSLDLAQAAPGDSIAVNGVCLTVVELPTGGFAADVSAETLRCTTLGALARGARVNLEPALRVGDALGGHLVSGHVDGVATLLRREPDGESVRMWLEAPASLARYVAHKGSVCLDGVSLTVNSVQAGRFSVNLVPHTLAVTTLGEWQAGQSVNLEVDLLARYLERLVSGADGARS